MGQLNRVDVSCRIPGKVRWYTVKLVEAMRGRKALWLASKMPLAENCRGVTRTLEQFTHSEGACRKRIGTAFDGNKRKAAADRVLARHQRRSRRRTGRFDQELGKAQSLASHLIDVRRRC